MHFKAALACLALCLAATSAAALLPPSPARLLPWLPFGRRSPAGSLHSEAAEAHRVHELPGWGKLTTRLYSGEVPISKDKAMFYALVEAEGCCHADDAPVVLWLTGCGHTIGLSVHNKPAIVRYESRLRELVYRGAPATFQHTPALTAHYYRAHWSLAHLPADGPSSSHRCSGPGCSSVGTAFIGEHGPFFPHPGSTSKLMENPYRRAGLRLCLLSSRAVCMGRGG